MNEESLFVSDEEPVDLEEAMNQDPSGDELDELLAEDEARDRGSLSQDTRSHKKDDEDQRPVAGNQEDEFAAEMEVMAEMGW